MENAEDWANFILNKPKKHIWNDIEVSEEEFKDNMFYTQLMYCQVYYKIEEKDGFIVFTGQGITKDTEFGIKPVE